MTFTIYINKIRLLSVHCSELKYFAKSFRFMHQESQNQLQKIFCLCVCVCMCVCNAFFVPDWSKNGWTELNETW